MKRVVRIALALIVGGALLAACARLSNGTSPADASGPSASPATGPPYDQPDQFGRGDEFPRPGSAAGASGI